MSRFAKLKEAFDERREAESAPSESPQQTPKPAVRKPRVDATPRSTPSPEPRREAQAPESASDSQVQRNGLSMLPEEWQMVDELRNAYFAETKKYVKMNVIIRAAVRALRQAPTASLVDAVRETPELKPGRKASRTG